MLDYKGANFSTFDVDQSNVVIEYENGNKQNVDCQSWMAGLGGTENSTSCKANTNFNAFNFNYLMYEGNQAYTTQVSINRNYEKHYTHCTFYFQIKVIIFIACFSLSYTV